LGELNWPGPEEEISLPIPVDLRGIVDRAAEQSLIVVAGGDPLATRQTLCSIIDRARVPVAVTLAVPPAALAELQELLPAIATALPTIELVDASEFQPRSGAYRLDACEELAWGWLGGAGSTQPPTVAYLVPGLSPEGSGGVHSVVQEARGLRELGARALVCLPGDALGRAERLYGNSDGLFVAYARDAAIADAVRDASVAVATEHTSIPLLSRLTRDRPDLRLAYYIQDYEPLFAELGSPRSDRALMSYGALPEALLFAKSHFIRNVVGALHCVPVAKVEPSLDGALFNANGRRDAGEHEFTVIAMIRPRTPRRRPQATLACLSIINAALGDDVTIITFGCDAAELAEASDEELGYLTHLGRLSRSEVAEQLRRSDVFVDGSAYQAFGRSGLEAMACGVIPILPSLGGVCEYAFDGRNAIMVEDDSPGSLAHEVISLAGDRARLRTLRNEAIQSAAAFSIDRAARSQLAMFTALASAAPGSFRAR
jgi:hypothetical protein